MWDLWTVGPLDCGTIGLWDLWTVGPLDCEQYFAQSMLFSGIHIALIMASRSQRATAFNAGTVSLRKSKQRVGDRSRCYARPMDTAPYES